MIALYPNTFNTEFTITSVESIVQAISSGQWADNISYLRRLGKREYDEEKKKLPAVTWGGVFKPGTREIRKLEKYSQLVVLDVDHIDISAVPILKEQVCQDPFVRCCFVSPSGKGLKMLVQVNTGPREHRAAFLHLQSYFEGKYPLKLDKSGKDVSRLCYVSYDHQLYYNPSSALFEVEAKYGEVISESRPLHTTAGPEVTKTYNVFNVCVKWVENNKTYRDGEKNVYIHALACAMNRCGVSQDDTITLINENYATPDQKWHQSVRSAYFHNQHEHASVQIRDIGSKTFLAPEYVINLTDDVAAADVMYLASAMFKHSVPNGLIMDIVNKICRYYDKMGYIDMRRNSVDGMVSAAWNQLQQNIQETVNKIALPFLSAEEMGQEVLCASVDGIVETVIPSIKLELGNVYGCVGMGESFKSMLAQYMCFINAMNGIPSLYCNGEMSMFQFYARFVNMAFGIDLRKSMENGSLTKEHINSFIEQVNAMTKNNLMVINTTGYTHQNLKATIELIASKKGKDIRFMVVDGLSQCDWGGRDEITATIPNAIMLKELAKEKNMAVMPLIHTSGGCERWYRDTAEYARGGKKVVTQMDGYFCTSRLVDPITNELVNEDDIRFLPGKFYLRYKDKRTQEGMLNCIVNAVTEDKGLKLLVESNDPASYELKIQKPR